MTLSLAFVLFAEILQGAETEKGMYHNIIPRAITRDNETYLVNKKKDPTTLEYHHTMGLTPKEPISESESQNKPPQVQKDRMDIYFNLNQSDLSASQKDQLNTLSIMNIVGPITVVGYACPLGSLHVNQVIAEKRARNVEHYLKTLTKHQINTYARPTSYRLHDDVETNRRVDVFYIHPAVTPP